MGSRIPGNGAPEEDAFQKLAEDLRTETSAEAIVRHLDAFITGIHDPLMADERATSFLRAGGLPTLISILRGRAFVNATADSDAVCRATMEKAAQAFYGLHVVEMAGGMTREELSTATNVVPPLIDALRAAPTLSSRSAATSPLRMLATAQPGASRAMVEAGVVELVIALYIDIVSMSPDVWDLHYAVGLLVGPGALGQVLLSLEPRAATDLRRVIRGPQALPAFNALIIIQDCLKLMPRDDFLAAIGKAGIVEDLVAMLRHESPFCIAAAAGALGWVRRSQGEGLAVLEASGAIPALVRVIKRQIPPAALERESVAFSRHLYKAPFEDCETDLLNFADPSAMAIVSLSFATPFSRSLFASFLTAGGVAALLHMLERPTSCPVTLAYTADLVSWLMEEDIVGGTSDQGGPVVDKLFVSGGWTYTKHAIHLLGFDYVRYKDIVGGTQDRGGPVVDKLFESGGWTSTKHAVYLLGFDYVRYGYAL